MKYVIEFSKTGTICYTSHLDIMKVFMRSFKRADIGLAYSQGFNPHPKMGFAQPLSLGYEALEEYIEFETRADRGGADASGEELLEKLRALMPHGLELKSIRSNDSMTKTLAADTIAAEYTVRIPLDADKLARLPGPVELWKMYMGRNEILTLKRQKQKKKGRGKGGQSSHIMVEVNIRPKIRELTFRKDDGELVIDMLLDSGSVSNLSPELVISTVNEMLDLGADRSDIAVIRRKILFESYDTGH